MYAAPLDWTTSSSPGPAGVVGPQTVERLLQLLVCVPGRRDAAVPAARDAAVSAGGALAGGARQRAGPADDLGPISRPPEAVCSRRRWWWCSGCWG
jgi:hypothetical protein